MSRRKGPRGLSPEEAALWDKIAARTVPLHPRKKKPSADSPEPQPPAIRPAPKAPVAPFSIGEKARGLSPPHDLARPVSEALRDATVAMDRKAHRRMVRGKLAPEARIDLHGMTLADAHPALTRFVMDASARGLRLVLVITGKGRIRDDDGPIPARPGALRHHVPQWLNSGPLRALVLQVTEAHATHGGSGAYYVYLRRRR